MEFAEFKKNIIGDEIYPIFNAYGKKVLYADWAASGRLYWEIEKKILENYAPYYSNIHSNGNYIAEKMEVAYEESRKKILTHFGCNNVYELIATGYGMTAAANKLITILQSSQKYNAKNAVVFLSPYEHNSNYITWKESGYNCVVLNTEKDGQIDIEDLKKNLYKYEQYHIIASFSACSNVSGIIMNLKEASKLIKDYNGILCVDYTTIAPYADINMEGLGIDALVFSSHKFLGGVGGPGILIINRDIYELSVPSNVGGGVVKWVNPLGGILYKESIHDREEAGTPPIMQLIKLGLAIDLKDKMGRENISRRESEITRMMTRYLQDIPQVHLYDGHVLNRLPIFSFNIAKMDYKKVVSILDAEYGIQTRGGCCCASIYGHRLLDITREQSESVIEEKGGSARKYGWVRVSLAPVVTDEEVRYICSAIGEIGEKYA